MFYLYCKCLQSMQMLICIAKVYKINQTQQQFIRKLPIFLRYIINMYKNTTFNTNILRFA